MKHSLLPPLDLAVLDYSGEGVSVLMNTTSGKETVVQFDEGDEFVPGYYALRQNYPNPFNASTTIRYDVPIARRMKLCIYDVVGQRIRTLVDERMEAGSHCVVWEWQG